MSDALDDVVDTALGMALWLADFGPDEWAEILHEAGLSYDDMRALANAMLRQSRKQGE